MKNGTIDINLKFSAAAAAAAEANLVDLNFSHDNLKDFIYSNDSVHECLKSLIKNITSDAIVAKEQQDNDAETQVTVHQTQQQRDDDESNPKRIPSLKSSHSMENLLKKKSDLVKVKANSVDMLDQNESDGEYIENGESIELIFISDEFVNKAQKSEKVIVLDRGRRRLSQLISEIF